MQILDKSLENEWCGRKTQGSDTETKVMIRSTVFAGRFSLITYCVSFVYTVIRICLITGRHQQCTAGDSWR